MSALDLAAYLERIGVSAPVRADLDTLRRLHLAHVTSIVFENLDIFLGVPIKVDLAGVQAKLVGARRGGYCFEHNTLFAAALEAIGFEVTRLGARVGDADPSTLHRTHMILLVQCEGTPMLCDVGFGAGDLYEPFPFTIGEQVTQYGRTFALVETSYGYSFQQLVDGDMTTVYQFTLEEQYPVDQALANHYTSTHPDSGFVRTLTVQREGLDAQWILRGRTLTEIRREGETKHEIGDGELLERLSSVFGLDFPAGTRFLSPNEG